MFQYESQQVAPNTLYAFLSVLVVFFVLFFSFVGLVFKMMENIKIRFCVLLIWKSNCVEPRTSIIQIQITKKVTQIRYSYVSQRHTS